MPAPNRSPTFPPHPAGRGDLLREERGGVLVFTALATVVLLGASALAVDLGVLLTARVQSQRAADAGALAGAAILATPTGTAAGARAEAKRFANSHSVLTAPVEVEDGDVDVELVNDRVRVRVEHSIPTLFSKVFGLDAVHVSTVAAAEVVPAGSAACPIPIMAVDRWIDGDGDGLYDAGEHYRSCEDGEPCTGYNEGDTGTLLEIKSQNTSSGTSAVRTCGAENPEWYCWIDNQVGTGDVNTEELEDILFNACGNTEFEISRGGDMESSPGNKMSVVETMKQFIDDHGGTDLVWNGTCVWDGAQCLDDHPRIRPMPIAEPTTIQFSGQRARATVVTFAPVFFEKVASSADQPHGGGPAGHWNIYVRLLEGHGGGIGTGGQPGSLLKAIVLVE